MHPNGSSWKLFWHEDLVCQNVVLNMLNFHYVGSGLYLHAVTETKLVVDTSRGETLRINVMFFFLLQESNFEIRYDCSLKLTGAYAFWHLRVQFDVTFSALPCSILSLDAMDISGEQHLDVVCITIDR